MASVVSAATSAARAAAAKKGAQTKKDNKECEDQAKAVAVAAGAVANEAEDSAIQYITTALKADPLTMYTVKELLEQNLLAALVNPPKGGQPVQSKEKVKLSPSTTKWRMMPLFAQKRMIRDMNPDLYVQLMQQGEKKKIDLLPYIYHAYQVTPDDDVPGRKVKKLMFLEPLYRACLHRYGEMGKRLSDGAPSELAFWKLVEEEKAVELRVGKVSAKIPLFFPRLSEEATITKASSMHDAVLTDKKYAITQNLMAFALLEENADKIGDLKMYLYNASVWKVPAEVLGGGDDDVNPSDSVSCVGGSSEASPSTEASKQGEKRSASVADLEARLKEKSRNRRMTFKRPAP
mmetsp:Transcript_44506/g.105469  ORF Transcript_44506/g.105469 Transcript_44506/m.105469 type:complete len:348 (+) Transcript_44506:83-1126(+)